MPEDKTCVDEIGEDGINDNAFLNCIPVTDPAVINHARGGFIAGGLSIKSFVANWDEIKDIDDLLDLKLNENKIATHRAIYGDKGILIGQGVTTARMTRDEFKEAHDGIDGLWVWAARSKYLEVVGPGVTIQNEKKPDPADVIRIGGKTGLRSIKR
ncbi:MAG: hypothetical protein WC565_03370 [Parcubacteria group bacterium]|jgi:hypothetical protein